MDVSLELYRVFLAVAETRGFSKAAESLFVSQSAVSQSIKTLEKKLGFPLFVRTTKKVELTANAEMLWENLSKAFSIIYGVEARLRNNQNPYGGELKIAATDTLCKYFLLEKIKILHEKYPEIKIKIINGTSLYCLELLKKGKIDFAVVNIPEKLENKFRVESHYSFNDVFVAKLDFAISERASLLEVSQKPLLVLDDKSVTREFLNRLFLQKSIVIEPEIELQNIDILIEMAKIGLGISFVPDLCIKESGLKVIKIKEKVPARKYGIISLKELPLTAVTNTFLSML